LRRFSRRRIRRTEPIGQRDVDANRHPDVAEYFINSRIWLVPAPALQALGRRHVASWVMNLSDGSLDRSSPLPVLGGVAVLVVTQLLIISLLYKHGFTFECRARAPATFCGFLSSAVLRAVAALGVAALLLGGRPVLRSILLDGRRRRPDPVWLGVQLAGFALLLAPLAYLDDASGDSGFALAVALWLSGATMAGVGAAMAAFRSQALHAAAAQAGGAALIAAVIAIFSPEIADVSQRVWAWSPITYATFHSAEFALKALGQTVISEPAEVLLQVGDFAVLVGRQCSGVEGVALITGFTCFYLHLFRKRLRFPHALILLPIGVAASWLLNIVRIAALVMIGAHVSPELAVEGFHSHAGWLLFTMLAMALIAAAHATPQLRIHDGRASRTSPAAPPPLRQDWNAARLLPFVAFMLSALIASTFFETPQQVYPLRFAVTAVAILFFLPHYRALRWRADPVSILAGLAIGALWIVTSPPPSETDAALAAWLAAAPTTLFMLWIVTRTLGTILVVPLVEELVFRSYVLQRANFGGRPGLLFAIGLSSALFAALHDRWLAAALAGLVFALLALRSGRLTDAIVAHAVANTAIAAAAMTTGDWSKI
jgi:exosortase E/protease (VPEID-CTERM system)